MTRKALMWLVGGGFLVVFGVGVSSATWAKKYIEFPTVWAQEAAQFERRFEREAREERQQTLIMREMLANQMWLVCTEQEEADVCKVQQDSLRMEYIVQDSTAMVQDSVRAAEGS